MKSWVYSTVPRQSFSPFFSNSIGKKEISDTSNDAGIPYSLAFLKPNFG